MLSMQSGTRLETSPAWIKLLRTTWKMSEVLDWQPVPDMATTTRVCIKSEPSRKLYLTAPLTAA